MEALKEIILKKTNLVLEKTIDQSKGYTRSGCDLLCWPSKGKKLLRQQQLNIWEGNCEVYRIG